MLGVVLTMLGVSVAWAAIYVVLTGWASLLDFIGPDRRQRFTGERFWVGLALVIAFLQIWHLCLPVDWRAGTAVAIVGLAGFRKSILDGLREPRRLFLVLSAAIILWTANQCLKAPEFYDAGLYYFQSIRWLNEYPIVPGLGNLHGRLAFNQSYFILPALLNAAPYFDKGHHLANGLLLSVLAIQLLHRTMASDVLPLRLFSGFMLIVVLRQIERESLASPMPDIAIFAVGVLLMLWFLEFLIRVREPSENAAASPAWLIAIAVLGITFKLSFLGFAVATIALTLWILVRVRVSPLGNRLAVAAALLAVSLVAVWMTRGVVTSGYPMYPGALAGLPVDWKVPEARAAQMSKVTSVWAQNLGQRSAEPNDDWFRPWLARVLKSSEVNRPLGLFFAAGVTLAGLRLQRRIKLERNFWLPLLPPTAWLLFWFCAAPDPRFARAALWLLAAWPMALAMTHFTQIWRWDEKRVLCAVLVIALILIVPRVLRIGSMVTDLAASGFGTLPQPQLREYHTISGLKLFVPVGDDRAWNAPLPSTPAPDAALEMRGRTLREGFRLRGQSGS